MIAGYGRLMPPRRLHAVLLPVLPLLLGACAWGATFSPITPLEREVNGLYEGLGVGGTGRVPYRLTLTVQERAQKASGVLVNLESRKSYAATGTFKRAAGGYALELTMFENGDQHRANLHATWQSGGKIGGLLRTVLLGRELLGYGVNLNKVSEAAPVPTGTPLTTTGPAQTPPPQP